MRCLRVKGPLSQPHSTSTNVISFYLSPHIYSPLHTHVHSFCVRMLNVKSYETTEKDEK